MLTYTANITTGEALHLAHWIGSSSLISNTFVVIFILFINYVYLLRISLCELQCLRIWPGRVC